MKSTASTSRKQVKPLAPVCGSAKLLQAIGSVGPVENRTGEIAIDGKPYLCRCLDGCYQLFGFNAKKNETTHYDIAHDFTSCDCPDATYREERPEGCKHRKALKALVAAGKLPAIEGVIEDKQARDEDYIGDEQAHHLAAEYYSEFDERDAA